MIRLALAIASALGVVWLASGVEPREISARVALVRERLAPLKPLARDLLAPLEPSAEHSGTHTTALAGVDRALRAAQVELEPRQARASSPPPPPSPPPKPRPPRSLPALQTDQPPATIESVDVLEPAELEEAASGNAAQSARTAGLSQEAARQVRGRLDRVMGLATGRDW